MARCCVLVCAVLFASFGLLRAFQCPPSQYPYSSCSTCFTVLDDTRTFTMARETCEAQGGVLMAVPDAAHFKVLVRYLRGLNSSEVHWIGYKFISSGNVVNVTGMPAPNFVRNNVTQPTTLPSKFCLGFHGDDGFRVVNCSMMLPYLCQYTYTVPQTMVDPEAEIVYVSQSQTLSATVTGVGMTGIEWRLNGSNEIQNVMMTPEPISSSAFGKSVSLKIDAFDASYHPGTYELVVSSEVGVTVVATWRLQQAVLAPFNIQPADLQIPLGKIAAFECESNRSLPSPQVEWYKDLTLLNIESNNRFYVSDVSGTLFIREVQMSDLGMYHCVVSNIAGSMTSSPAQLSIVDTVSEPIFFIQPREMVRLVGQPYNLECVGVQSIQSNSITSFYDSIPIFLFGFPPPVMLGEFSYPSDPGFPIHRIESVELSDERECYACQIFADPFDLNNFDNEEATSMKASLTVHSIAQIQQLSVSWNGTQSTDSLHSIPQGSDITLSCSFTGVPDPFTVGWIQDGVPLTDGVITNTNVTKVTIGDFQISSVIQCTVENTYGRDVETVFLCLEETPVPPGLVTYGAQSDTNSSVFIYWNELQTPGSSHPLLLNYEIYLYDVPRNESSMITRRFGPFPTFQRNFIVSDLEVNTEYEVEVVGVSLVGRGVANGSVSVRTFPNAPSDPIATSNITVERSSDNTQLIIQWIPFTPVNTTPIAIATYEIQYRVAESNESEMMLSINGDSLLSIYRQVLDIDNAGSFEVRIRVKVQVQRDPPMFAHGPWSDYIEVQGITTPLTTHVTTPIIPTDLGITTERSGAFSGRGLLLLVVLLPVAFIAIVAVIVGTITGVVCLRRKPTKVYKVTENVTTATNSKPDPISSSSSSDPYQRPMGTQVFDLPISNSAIQLPDWDQHTPPAVAVTNHHDDAPPHSTTMFGNHSDNTQTTPHSKVREYNAYVEHHPRSSERSKGIGYSTFLDPHISHGKHNGVLPTKGLEDHPLHHRSAMMESSLVIASPNNEVFDRLEGFSDGSSPDPQLYEISIDSAYYEKENLGESTNSIAMMTYNATPEPLLPPDFDAV